MYRSTALVSYIELLDHVVMELFADVTPRRELGGHGRHYTLQRLSLSLYNPRVHGAKV